MKNPAGSGDASPDFPFVPPAYSALHAALPASLLLVLCILTYLPALDNGFISDDYVMLDWVEHWKVDPSFLLKMAPDVFRLTSYVVLLMSTWAFGYNSVVLYAFMILLHFVNSVLLFRLARLLTRSAKMACIAAVVFAVVQKPQEAIMWLAAMAYALGGTCVLTGLILWRRGRHLLSTIVLLIGLFTTESMVVLMLLVPLIDIWADGKFRWRRQYLWLIGPPVLFTAVFFATLPTNQMVNQRFYAFGWHAFIVFGKSMFRLVFPTLLIATVVLGIAERRLFWKEIVWGLAWMGITLLPFIFLTYQRHVPSRDNYVPAMGLALALAGLFAASRSFRLVSVSLAAFVFLNIGYIWVRKDAQYEVRARPTTMLLEQLRKFPPGRINVLAFPLNPWIAKMTARHVNGWSPEMIEVDAPAESCRGCPQFRWNERLETLVPVTGVPTGSAP